MLPHGDVDLLAAFHCKQDEKKQLVLEMQVRNADKALGCWATV
jgi:hypothetical protein